MHGTVQYVASVSSMYVPRVDIMYGHYYELLAIVCRGRNEEKRRGRQARKRKVFPVK